MQDMQIWKSRHVLDIKKSRNLYDTELSIKHVIKQQIHESEQAWLYDWMVLFQYTYIEKGKKKKMSFAHAVLSGPMWSLWMAKLSYLPSVPELSGTSWTMLNSRNFGKPCLADRWSEIGALSQVRAHLASKCPRSKPQQSCPCAQC